MATKRSDQEWKQKLTSESFHVTREKGTERPFTGKYDKHFEDGQYKCVCCGAILFKSEDKFNSGCGWPAFSRVAGASKSGDDQSTNVERHSDDSLGMQRVEVTCKECDAHLGHVFDDGPTETKLRYCINSASLNFEPKTK